MTQETNSLIVGASVAGLASAGCFGIARIDYIVIEKHAAIVTPWRNHYERLHLHTNKNLSHLPYRKLNPIFRFIQDVCRSWNIWKLSGGISISIHSLIQKPNRFPRR